jgi:uncharacterized protein (DUF433 family)
MTESATFIAMTTTTETAITDIGSLIVSSPEVLGGKPRVRGHRVPVHRIAGWWQLGLSVEEIAEKHPPLGPAEIHAALAYYHLHRAEVEGYLSEERGAFKILT